MAEFSTRPATEPDIASWAALRSKLWPAHPHHAYDLRNYFDQTGNQQIAFLVFASSAPEVPIGFIELSLRHDIIASGNPPSAYIEGWYVSDFIRHAGAGKTLLAAAETWAKSQGCQELTSDCAIDNHPSASAHLGCGFQESHRSISFRKEL